LAEVSTKALNGNQVGRNALAFMRCDNFCVIVG